MPGMKTTQQMRDELLLKGMAGGGEVKAPVTPTGFYSPLEEAALRIQRKVGNAQAFMNDLRTVPKEHLQHAGVDKLLTSRPTLTREELQQHISQAAPRVKVKVLGRDGKPNNDEWEPDDGRIGNTRYGQYTLPGGQNYREMLLTLPQNPEAGRLQKERESLNATSSRDPRYVDLTNRIKASQYKSGHWDEPNVLAHIRMNDRTDKDGKKVLFVEEIQSDWGQEGKKKGFKQDIDREGIEAKMRAITARLREIAKSGVEESPEMQQEWNRLSEEKSRLMDSLTRDDGRIPAAPFVTKTNDWVNLALKHILKTAAQEGHDRVAFVRGEQAADRFGLDKHFSRVAARPTPTGGYQLQTIMKDGRREDSIDVPPDKLHEYVGQDLADKIHSQRGGVFEGGDLRMPQTGIRKFYDELVPAQAHGLIKKYGGQLGTVQVPLEDGVSEHPGFDITPEMRQAILKPMSYKVGGTVPMMDAMRLQVWDKKTHKKDGGQVEDEYRGEHKAPGPTSGKPMHDLTDVYPEDFYGPNGFRYYADMGNDYDRKSYLTTRVARGNPQQKVWIHRSIPTDVYQRAMKSASPLQQMIRPGDWVTISKEYAKEHGEGALKGDYKIASKMVPAADIYTNGDSIHEWGYYPGQRSDKE